jgi:hypothetical protein
LSTAHASRAWIIKPSPLIWRNLHQHHVR